MSKAIVIGAGQIGRGFIGMELSKAGYQLSFADINQKIIEDINTRKKYTVYVVDRECEETIVENVSAVFSDGEEFPGLFTDRELSLVCTCVGQTALAKIAPAVARGISLRKRAGITDPMNVIAVENAINGSNQLKVYISEYLNEAEKKYVEKYIGFPNSAVDRIIPQNPPEMKPGDVAVEKFFEWDLERGGIAAPILPVAGLKIVDKLEPYLERKLFALNGPNAVTAYYGWIKGYETIKKSLEDPEIFDTVERMMEECSLMLEQRHGFSASEMRDYRLKIMERFLNPYIIDSVARVAREPLRKLAPEDRIIAPMKYAHSYCIETSAYYTGIAAALLYNNPNDEQSRQMQQYIGSAGVYGALERFCGLEKNSAVSKAIAEEYCRLSAANMKY